MIANWKAAVTSSDRRLRRQSRYVTFALVGLFAIGVVELLIPSRRPTALLAFGLCVLEYFMLRNLIKPRLPIDIDSLLDTATRGAVVALIDSGKRPEAIRAIYAATGIDLGSCRRIVTALRRDPASSIA